MYVQEYINNFAFGYSTTAKKVPDSEYHCKNDYEIVYVRKGERLVFVKDQSFHLKCGNLMFIDKTEIHKSRFVTEEYERFIVNFTDDYIYMVYIF